MREFYLISYENNDRIMTLTLNLSTSHLTADTESGLHVFKISLASEKYYKLLMFLILINIDPGVKKIYFKIVNKQIAIVR